jgi:D-3-phosphoglycerate dehydrogenase
MITQFTAVFGKAGINISDMVNKSKGEYAITVLDIESATTDEVVKELQAVDGVFRVRVVK